MLNNEPGRFEELVFKNEGIFSQHFVDAFLGLEKISLNFQKPLWLFFHMNHSEKQVRSSGIKAENVNNFVCFFRTQVFIKTNRTS